MKESYIPFLSFLFYIVSSHDYASQRIGFWKDIYVILTAHNSMFATNVRKTSRKCEAEQHVIPGRVKICIYNSFGFNLSRGENFTPVKTGGLSLPGGKLFFQFLSCKHCKEFDQIQGWAQAAVKLTLEQNVSCKQAHFPKIDGNIGH